MMRRISKRTVLIIVIGTVSNLLLLVSGVLTGALTSTFPSLLFWIILGGIVVLAILTTVLAIWSERLRTPPAMPHAEAFSPENRRIMLGYVQDKWVVGFLNNELYYDKELLSLELHRCIGDPSDLVLQNPLEPAEALPLDTTITEVFDQAGGELLILGQPGAGKTTLLLELARDLLERAKADKEDRIPVVLILSSWSIKQLPLEQWIADELKAKYLIDPRIGRPWAEAHRLLLLLDGLDEVAPDALPACIEALNEYAHKAQKAMVVCCRTNEYMDQHARLCLHTAVSVQLLSPRQIDDYLSTLGTYVSGLKSALHQSAALRALATTPLFLKVLILAYHGKPVQELLALVNAMPADQQPLIFHDYVERVLQREGPRLHTTTQQTRHWLAWLARQMTVYHQSELYLEQLQPDWLEARQTSLYDGSLVVFFGLLGGLLTGLLAWLFFGLPGGLLAGLFSGLLIWPGLGAVVSFAKIKPAETFTWSWTNFRSGLRGLLGGLLLGIIVCLSVLLGGLHLRVPIWLLDEWLISGLIGGLLYGLLLGLIDWLSPKQLSKYLRHSPNEGIKRSVKNGLVVGLVVGLLTGSLVGVPVGLFSGLFRGLVVGLLSGLISGLIFGLLNGLLAAAQHTILRLWLWQARATPTPWRYVAFLDDAVEQLLLRKVGGGYIFRHRLLQDYFASLEVVPSPDPSVSAEAHSVAQNTPNSGPSL